MNRAIGAGALVGAALAAGFWAAAMRSLDGLDQSRVAAADVAAQVAAADALPQARFRFEAGSGERARSRVAATLRRRAAAAGVLIERMAPRPPLAPGIARMSVALSGSEKGVLTLADAIEREAPGVRWWRWRLESPAAGTVRLTGELAAAWR